MVELLTNEGDPLDSVISALGGIGQGVANYQQGMRQNKADAREDEDSRARRVHALAQAGYIRQRAAQDAQAASQSKQLFDFQMAREHEAQTERESNRQVQASIFTDVFGGEAPESIYGPPADGVDLSTGMPPEVQRAARAVIPHLKDMSPDDIRQLRGDLRDWGKRAVGERRRAALQQQLSIWREQPQAGGAKQQGPGSDGAPVSNWEGWLPAAQADKLERALRDPNADPDLIADSMRRISEARAQQITDQEDMFSTLGRLDTEFQDFEARRMEMMAKGFQLDPEKYAQARTLRHQLEAHPLSGRALQAAELRIQGMLMKAWEAPEDDFGGGSSSSSRRRGGGAPSDPDSMALEVWGKLADGERTIESFDKLRERFRGEALQAKGDRIASANYDSTQDYGGMQAMGAPAVSMGQQPSALPVQQGGSLPVQPGAQAGAGSTGATPRTDDEIAAAVQEMVKQGVVPRDPTAIQQAIERLRGQSETEGTTALVKDIERRKKGYVSKADAEAIKRDEEQYLERTSRSAARTAKAEADKVVDEQFMQSAIGRMPSTLDQWRDDMDRVRDLLDPPGQGESGYSKKARRLLAALKAHGEAQGWKDAP